jgi:hypothetical protein
MAKQCSYLDLPPWNLPSTNPENWLYMERQSFANLLPYHGFQSGSFGGKRHYNSNGILEISNLFSELMALPI